jgi:chromate transporter
VSRCRRRRAGAAARDAVTLPALTFAFLKIAMASLGGGLSAWALRVIVEERRWLTEEEFLAALTICRILPGPNQVNMAVYVGARFRGLAGAAAALAGLTLVPLAIVLALGAIYFGNRTTPGLQATMTGLVAAAAGMTLSVGVKLSLGYVRQPWRCCSPWPHSRSGRHAVAAPARARGARSHRDRLVLAAGARRARQDSGVAAARSSR